MTNSEFREWLKGFFELSDEGKLLTPERVQIIINHLNLAEAVENGLDSFNEQLRADLYQFREDAQTAPPDFDSLTRDIRSRILN